MSTKSILTILIGVLLSTPAIAQQIGGYVYENLPEGAGKQGLPGVNVVWLGTDVGTATDMDGFFSIPITDETDQLVFSFIGFQSDTITAKPGRSIQLTMTSGSELDVVNVEARKSATSISGYSHINQQYLSEDEFKKAACCNLSESFETNATVDVSYADGVTGAKVIRMLGLDGEYTQFTIEAIPGLRGLGRTYGMNYIPGMWLQSVQISKGVGSVVNGYESMTGQINLELKKPDESPRFYIDAYGNHMGRTETNIGLSKKFNPKLSTLLLTHGSLMRTEMDHNNDDYLDVPMTQQINVLNRWKYAFHPDWRFQIGGRVVHEDRRAGHMDHSRDVAPEVQPDFGVDLATKRYEGFTKLGHIFKTGIERSLGWQNKYAYHNVKGYYGRKYYAGTNNTFSSNLIFETAINTTMHKIRTGASFLYDDYAETFGALQPAPQINIDRTEIVPGAFMEYTYSYLNTFSMVAGMRGDYHNLYGFFWSPRLHLRYNPAELTTLRLSGGRGYRVANIFADNTSILVSARDVILQEPLQPEVSWNFGASFTQKFNFKNREASINIDYYRTEFESQVILDLDNNRYESRFYNLDGRSYSNSVQVDVMMEVVRGLDVKLAYKFNDVKVTYKGILLQQLLVPMHQGHFNIGYITPKESWKFDATLQLNGRARLANSFSQSELPNGDFSPVFVTLHAQVTKVWKSFEVYVGAENLTGFTQENPIIAGNQPYGIDFDASNVWGPLMRQVVYVGVRYTLK